jgi:glycosyltransferase involved in cell wall biosynthesis
LSNTPPVTIITANYNKGKDVTDCVDSVLAQTQTSWEFLFIDDGSTDGSFETAKAVAKGDERCKFLNNTTGIKGANAARNMGLDIAKGRYIIFLDSDDVMKADCLEKRLKAFEENSDYDYLVFPMGLFFDEVGDSDIICNIPTLENNLVRFLNRDIVWLISGPIWKKEVLKSLGGFDLDLQSQQDYDLHVRALIQDLPYKYFHTAPDVFYRRNVESLPRNNSQSVAHFNQRFEMIQRHYEMLKERKLVGAEVKLALSRYLLDLAQMMRWHIAELGKPKAFQTALTYWQKADEFYLVSKKEYRLGIRYIKFKHQMFYNRFPKLQKRISERYEKQLGKLIFTPSTTYCNTTLVDYGEQ